MKTQSSIEKQPASMLRRITAPLLCVTLMIGIALGMTGCGKIGSTTEDQQKTQGNEQSEQAETTANSSYTDAKLEAEDEAVKLLNDYCDNYSEFSCKDTAKYDDSKSIYGLIAHPSSVDYGNYPVKAPRELTTEESEAVLNKSGYSAADSFEWLKEYDKESVEWVAKNVFNMDKQVLDDMIAKKLDSVSSKKQLGLGDIFNAKGSDGKDKYYLCAGSLGGGGVYIDVTWVRTDGKRHYLKFDQGYYSTDSDSYDALVADGYDGTGFETKYAVLERKEIDGKKYWTVYEISKNIPENVFAESSSDAFSKINGEYATANSYSELEVDESGKSAGNYFHTALDGIHDYQHSQYDITFSTPEKIDKYTYRVKVEKLSYKNKVGSEDDQNGEKTIYVESPHLKEGSTVCFYVKGTPFAKLIAECKGGFDYSGEGTNNVTGINCVYIPEARACYYEAE